MVSPIVALSTALISTAGLMAEPTPRQPSGAWVVAYEESVCLLQRTYGAGEQAVTLAFKQWPTNPRIGIHIFEPSATKLRTRGPVTIGFGPGLLPIESTLEASFIRDKLLRLYSSGLTRAELQGAEASEVLSLNARKGPNYSFAVSGLRKALAKVDECIADLLVRWGLTPEEQARTARYPVPATALVTANDYPSDALQAGIRGETLAFVRVDARGDPSDCKVAKSSGNKSLDMATCRAMLRARYSPALDRSGQPLDSLYATNMRWTTE